jgi:hypothetical protein
MKSTTIGKRILRSAAPAMLLAYAAVHWLGKTYGSTALERHAGMAGDHIIPRPQFVITHSITIDATPETVWPWLVQMGWHRGGWYTAQWVDKLLFPENRASADHILEEFQDLHIGDFIPDGAPETECASSSSSSNRRGCWCCTPRLICRWNGDATAERQLIGLGYSQSCRPIQSMSG